MTEGLSSWEMRVTSTAYLMIKDNTKNVVTCPNMTIRQVIKNIKECRIEMMIAEGDVNEIGEFLFG